MIVGGDVGDAEIQRHFIEETADRPALRPRAAK
jgi:hypothetical protein